jgi:DNA invertase Pin-like site-specific DNA recombinase
VQMTRDKLLKLAAQLKTDAMIGRRLGVTRQRVQQMRKKYGIPSRFAGNAERNREIISLFKQGTSLEALAYKFDLAVMTIYAITQEARQAKKRKRRLKKS